MPSTFLRHVERNVKDVSNYKPVAQHLNLPNHSTQNMVICGLSMHQGNTESRKNLEQKFIFQLGSLNPHGINERFSPPLPLLHRKALVSPEEKSTPMINPEERVVDTPSMVPDALATPIKSKIPLPVPTPSQPAYHPSATTPSVLDTPTSTPERGKLRKGRILMVARLRSNKKWMPY